MYKRNHTLEGQCLQLDRAQEQGLEFHSLAQAADLPLRVCKERLGQQALPAPLTVGVPVRVQVQSLTMIRMLMFATRPRWKNVPGTLRLPQWPSH